MAAFSGCAPGLALTFTDPCKWSSCTLPALASAANAFALVTQCQTFHDLALSSQNKGAYMAITASTAEDVTAALKDPAKRRPPDITHLPLLAGRQPQRAFCYVLQRNSYLSIVNDTSLPLTTRCRVRQATLNGAGRFQSVVPDSKEMELDNQQYLVNWWLRYGFSQSGLEGRRCVRGCKQFGAGCSFVASAFTDGVHSLDCRASNMPYKCHQAMLNCVEEFVESIFDGATCSRKHVACHFSDGGEVDTVLDRPFHGGKRAGIDVTVVNSFAPSYVCEPAAQDAMYPIKQAEAEKERRHRAQCTAAGMEYYSVVFTPGGGVAGSFMTDVFEPHFKRERAAAKKRGEDPWEVEARRGRILDRWSVVMARCNAKKMRQSELSSCSSPAPPPPPPPPPPPLQPTPPHATRPALEPITASACN
ncbi:hypothetical protein OAO87_00095 [bacterium]|nr:hypothetical protein [bacterium]